MCLCACARARSTYVVHGDTRLLFGGYCWLVSTTCTRGQPPLLTGGTRCDLAHAFAYDNSVFLQLAVARVLLSQRVCAHSWPLCLFAWVLCVCLPAPGLLNLGYGICAVYMYVCAELLCWHTQCSVVVVRVFALIMCQLQLTPSRSTYGRR